MKDHLDSLIVDQINRALSLKKLIPYPMAYTTLSGVAERCNTMLEDQIKILEATRRELYDREDNDIRDIFRQMKICARDISEVESYGIPPLYYQTEELGLLNDILFRIHSEIKLPFPHPAVCCTSNKYYFAHPATNTIYVPLGESEFLLHMPDLYHELGHYVLINSVKELRLKPIKEGYMKAMTKINNYYTKLIKTKKREFGPKDIPYYIERIKEQWNNYWMVEFFCDLFALFTVGPAYAWSHLHLTAKTSSEIHALSILLDQTHPSDEARMRLLAEGMKILEYSDEVNQIKEKWSSMEKFLDKPTTMYQYAFPSNLLKEIANSIFDSFRQTGISFSTPENLSSNKEGNEMKILFNEAWDRFWRKSPEEFRKWEESKISELKKQVKSTIISN